ncbi:MAG: DUF1554 domain-containing protein [Leptospirales bacterium]|nr:DUF1554 domain-containing protein [Leptospirales bacterium]
MPWINLRTLSWATGILLASLNCAQALPVSTSAAGEALMTVLLAGAQTSVSTATATSAPTPSCSSSAFCYTYRTTALSNANLGGISGADATCNSNANKPGAATGTFKALLADDPTNARRASVTANAGDGQIDWVLYANKQYRRSDGVTVIATSNANRLFTFPLTVGFIAGAGGHWTGFGAGWTSDATNCAGWTNGVAGTGRDGTDNGTGTGAISNILNNCNTTGPGLICIEQ